MYVVVVIVGFRLDGSSEILKFGEWKHEILDTCASATWSLHVNLTESTKIYGCLKIWITKHF